MESVQRWRASWNNEVAVCLNLYLNYIIRTTRLTLTSFDEMGHLVPTDDTAIIGAAFPVRNWGPHHLLSFFTLRVLPRINVITLLCFSHKLMHRKKLKKKPEEKNDINC